MKSLTLPRLRLGVFLSWLGFATLLTALPFVFLLTPHWPREVDAVAARTLAFSLSTLWFPALGCFAGYWFGASESAAKPSRKHHAKLVALILTVAPLLGILVVVGLTLFTHSFAAAADGSPAGPSLVAKISELVTFLHCFAPLCYAPITFLTGRAVGSARAPDEG